MNLEATKLEIIKAIAELESEVLIKQIFFILKSKKNVYLNDPKKAEDSLAIAREPTPKYISLDSLKKEQGHSKEKLRNHYKNMDRSIWEGEDIKELIKALK